MDFKCDELILGKKDADSRALTIDSRFMLHASSPHSVALMQLRFTSFAVINLRRDLHPQECAHAGRIKKKAGTQAGFPCCLAGDTGIESVISAV